MAAFHISLQRWLSVLALILCSMPTSGRSILSCESHYERCYCYNYNTCSNSDSSNGFSCLEYKNEMRYYSTFNIKSLTAKCSDGSDYKFTTLDLQLFAIIHETKLDCTWHEAADSWPTLKIYNGELLATSMECSCLLILARRLMSL